MNQGFFPQLMVKLFGPSWKTGGAGAVAFLSSAVSTLNLVLPGVIPHQHEIVAGVTALGSLAAGAGIYFAKDHDVTGLPPPAPTCPVCGRKLDADAVFCPVDGTRVVPEKTATGGAVVTTG